MNTINRETGEDDKRISPCSRLISIIVPVYNTAPWLRRCLDSICAQSYRNLEILCVNDGSTDDSAEILAEYAAKDARIRVFTQENAGLAAARNTALEHATGEWVTGVDSDDYLAPGVYDRAVACITPGVDVVFFGVQNVAEDERPLPHCAYFDLPTDMEYEMIPEHAARLNVCFWSKLWRAQAIRERELRFPHGLVYEDAAFYCCMLPLIRKVAFCREPGYMYMQREGSIMRSPVTTEALLERNAAVYRYVAEVYRRNGWEPGTSPYFAVMFHGSFASLYQRADTAGQELLRNGFYLLAEEFAMRNTEWRDYRLRRLLPLPALSRLFVHRYLCSELIRVWRVPLWARTYDEFGRYSGSHFLLAQSLLRGVRRLFSRLIRN